MILYYLAWNSYGEPFYGQLISLQIPMPFLLKKPQAFDVDLGIVGVLSIT
jgi:hypothetical protein